MIGIVYGKWLSLYMKGKCAKMIKSKHFNTGIDSRYNSTVHWVGTYFVNILYKISRVSCFVGVNYSPRSLNKKW